jgi:hypothetical protein
MTKYTDKLTPLTLTGLPALGKIGALLARLRFNMRRSVADTECDTGGNAVRECGLALMVAAPTIDACTTLTQRCDLHNINVADRRGTDRYRWVG